MARARATALPLLLISLLQCLDPFGAASLKTHAVMQGLTTGHTSTAQSQDADGLASGRYPRPLLGGYLPVEAGVELYYAFWEAENPEVNPATAPIILWLQGGPGCASTFGGFYELGPFSVTDELELVKNPGSWAWSHGLLLIDQPFGTGYSQPAAEESIPRDELGMAHHLYSALQAFYTRHADRTGGRPLFITGESYAGKYVPSMAHYILQAQDMQPAVSTPASGSDSALGSVVSSSASDGGSSGGSSSRNGGSRSSSVGGAGSRRRLSSRPTGSGLSALLPGGSGGQLRVWRKLPADTPPPKFKLAGVAIGNGLTDPRAQVPVMSESAHYMGLVSPALRKEIASRAQQVVALIDNQSWDDAHTMREALREFITNVTGLGTMFDTRREQEYDPKKSVDRFLDLPGVKKSMGAHAGVNYTSCSKTVGELMAADTMQSVAHLLPDVIDKLHVLLYQGQFDILDGVASSIAWIDRLEWPGKRQLADDIGSLWRYGESVAGWKRKSGNLTHAVVYRAGHMVPHDQPEAARAMMEDFVRAAVSGAK